MNFMRYLCRRPSGGMEITMTITVAKNAGFCFGVSRAVEKIRALLASREPHTQLYTIGQLIHNPHIIAELSAGGVRVIEPEEIENIFFQTNGNNRTLIVVRTHGVERRVTEQLASYSAKNPFFSVIDCTCPYVKKIHRIVSEHERTPLYIFGDPTHPEVKGIRSYSSGPVFIFRSAAELEQLPRQEADGIMVSQTTQKLTEWKLCQNNIRKVCTNPKIFDTICSVTEDRQTAAENLSCKVDVMLVIGGRNSSNTNKLFETAKKNCRNTFFIESPEDVRRLPVQLTVDTTVGITAGASTPGSNIEEVMKQMADMENKIGTAAETEDFAGMLENSFKTLNTGDIVHGVIVSVSQNELHVDLGTKVTGIIAYDDVTDESGADLTKMFKVGDEIDAKVIKVSDRDGVAALSKKSVDGLTKWREIMDAYENGAVLEGKIREAVKGGVIMNYEGIRVFIPASHSGVPKDGDLNTLVGTVQKVKIIDVNEQRRRAVASIRDVLREERKEKEAKFWDEIEIGKEYDGVVKSMTSYGAFVDLGGVDGMVHSSELSWKRIKHPSDVVSIGETGHVFVKDFDKEAKRISLGYKTEATNPWNIFREKYSVGDIAEVKIVSLLPFGAFAEVVPGTDGLIHISQIADRKLSKPGDVLEIGQVVNAKIIDIDDEKHKISLSIRALLEDENAPEEYEDSYDAEN